MGAITGILVFRLSSLEIAEKHVAEQPTTHFHSNSCTVPPKQSGFGAKRSTETENCFFWENIKLKMDKGGVVMLCYVITVLSAAIFCLLPIVRRWFVLLGLNMEYLHIFDQLSETFFSNCEIQSTDL